MNGEASIVRAEVQLIRVPVQPPRGDAIQHDGTTNDGGIGVEAPSPQPVIEQHAMAHLMSTGKLDRHLRQTRQMYNRRRNLLVSALRAYVPEAQIMGARAGLHLIARLPPDVEENRVVADAAKRSVGVFGLGYYRIGRPRSAPGALVLGYASLNDTSITTGVQLISESIEAVRARTG